jgi:hypothetical protein
MSGLAMQETARGRLATLGRQNEAFEVAEDGSMNAITAACPQRFMDSPERYLRKMAPATTTLFPCGASRFDCFAFRSQIVLDNLFGLGVRIGNVIRKNIGLVFLGGGLRESGIRRPSGVTDVD